ncbi:MAG TPA: SRPBCC family protein [Desulfosalsimonadaceae bacterium]|nr:SRPBCC family protein [Desulfosalsimonadaceae bacterium]
MPSKTRRANESFYADPGRLFSISEAVAAPPQAVWQLLIDTQAWPEWGPSVAAVACKDRYIGPAAAGRIKTRVGLWVGFEVTDFMPGTCWAWRVAGIRATGHRVAARDEHRCRLFFDLPKIAAPYAWVCRTAARRIKRMAENS